MVESFKFLNPDSVEVKKQGKKTHLFRASCDHQFPIDSHKRNCTSQLKSKFIKNVYMNDLSLDFSTCKI